ncbi:fibronectin type III domain-containing protein [Flavobacterium rhizosphaerae]|uniref:Fibronectin type-III domain-containing protein n=1 Tax=Flavobacterium rhizosphaerae TaxID=3163298 RepID=A0ABW8YY15_9FLAO
MKKILIAIAVTVFALGCSKDDDGNGGSTGTGEAAVLLFPENNAECTVGTDVSTTEVDVDLKWNAAPDTEKYFVYIKNLETQSTLQYSAGVATNYTATLEKGTPYSWYVSSVKTAGGSKASETWKFYVAGDAVTNYAPFPAEVVSPQMSETIYGPTITLKWSGGDVDNDIDEYRVYLGTDSNPQTLLNTVSVQSLQNVSVTAGNTYYWKVITVDDAGNSSSSPIFQFKVI